MGKEEERKLAAKAKSQNAFNYLWKPLLISIGIISFYILTHRIWEQLFSVVIVAPILSKVGRNGYSDTIIVLAIISVLLFSSYRLWRKYIPSYKLFWATIVFTVIYSVYRFINPVWTFTSFSLVEWLKYFDLIFIIALSYLVLILPFYIKILSRTPEQEKNTKGFLFDEPIGRKDDEGEFGYEPYAKTVAEKLKHTKGESAFAMGINGKWGSGKTSFLNIVRNHLDKTGIIEIEFNPWNSHTPKAIIEDFFGTMQYELAKHHSGISKQIHSYSKKLVELNSNAITRGIQFSTSTLFGDESLNQLQKEIQESLLILNKKIVVYIDDLDRLDKSEIIEVLRLVRNTASFKNTIFVVCYDREYILKALKDLNDLSERYLEKIFQLEITLPFFKPSKLRVELKNRLCNIFPLEYHEIITRSLINGIGYHDSFRKSIDKWELNFRDITLIVNSLSLNSSNLLNEHHFPDLLKLELIRLKYPKVYELIYRKTDYLETNNSENKTKYRLKKEGSDYIIKTDLVNRKDEIGLSDIDISRLIEMLTQLFGINRYHSEDPDELSIVFPSKFYNYFTYGISEGKLSNQHFIQTFKLPIDELKKQIDDWVEQKLEQELKERLSIIREFDDKDHFEKLIQAIFYLAKRKTKFSEGNFQPEIGFSISDLFHYQIFNVHNKISSLYDDSNEWKSFVKSFFTNADPPFYFESAFLKYFNDYYHEDNKEYYFLEKKEGIDMAENLFSQYLEIVDQFDKNIWQLYYNNKRVIFDTRIGRYGQNPVASKRIVSKFKEFIKIKDLDGFIIEIINNEPRSNNYCVHNVVLELFDDWCAFSLFINDNDFKHSKCINEFRAFLSKFSSKSFGDYISFEFKEIPVNKRGN
jgi:ABC-type lipoprotein export system ATPase subunit